MKSQFFDIAIIGGGPSGCALASFLCRSGYHVVIIEQSRYEKNRIGEHLPPNVNSIIQKLGCWEAFLAQNPLPCPGLRISWGTEELTDRPYIINAWGHGWNLNRVHFDRVLAENAVQNGVSMVDGARVTSLSSCLGNWHLEVHHSVSGRSWVHSRFLIDATGRSSAIARKLGRKRLIDDNLVGAAVRYSSSSIPDKQDSSLYLESVENGWWYATSLPNRKFIAVFMTDGKLLSKRGKQLQSFWNTQLRQTKHIQKLLSIYAVDSKILVKQAYSSRLDEIAGLNWLAVGDAAASFDPLSSMGISHALTTSLKAGKAVHSFLDGESGALEYYGDQIKKEYSSYLKYRAYYYQLENRWPENKFWQHRHLASAPFQKISLDPNNVIEIEPNRVLKFYENDTSLSPHFLRELCLICTSPLKAHLVVSRFKEAVKQPFADIQIIQALQYLLERGIILEQEKGEDARKFHRP